MDFKRLIEEKIAVFDGAFGTALQRKTGGKAGTVPEKLNLERPDIIAEIHREYAAAGADVITANTFGANEIKIGSRELSDELIRAGVAIAKGEAGGKLVALDIGPLGRLLEPMGDIPFERAYDAFVHAVEAGKDADLILIETMSDLQELRAALLAAREHSDKMTFDESGRTFMGCDPVCFALTASPLADAIGVNCSLGPGQLLPVVQTILRYTDKPVLVQPNAGLPDEKMHYSVSAKEFAAASEEFLKAGARIVGGCCGTTPEYISQLRALADRYSPQKARYTPVSAVCSASRAVFIDGVKIIGERINPTGKKAMKQALLAGDYDFVQEQALEQADAGADILDVNAGLPELDEAAALERLVREVQAVCPLPLQIDTSNAAAAERALRAYCGKAVLNSVNGEEKNLRALLPVVKKYGAAVVGLTIDERGLPQTAQRRVEIAEKIIRTAEEYGIAQEDIYIDCLTLTASTEQAQALETLQAIRTIKEKYRVKTVLGVSNISFGLPNRKIINTSFLTAALFAGLDLPILNPNVSENMQAVAAYRVLSGHDKNCADYTQKYANLTGRKSGGHRGRDSARRVRRACGAAAGRDTQGAARRADVRRPARKGGAARHYRKPPDSRAQPGGRRLRERKDIPAPAHRVGGEREGVLRRNQKTAARGKGGARQNRDGDRAGRHARHREKHREDGARKLRVHDDRFGKKRAARGDCRRVQAGEYRPVRAFRPDDHDRRFHGGDNRPAAKGMPLLPRDGGRRRAQRRIREKNRRRLLL